MIAQEPVGRMGRPEEIAAARDRTAAALEGQPAVVFQAMLHDGTFGGLADFLVLRRDAEHPEGARQAALAAPPGGRVEHDQHGARRYPIPGEARVTAALHGGDAAGDLVSPFCAS